MLVNQKSNNRLKTSLVLILTFSFSFFYFNKLFILLLSIFIILGAYEIIQLKTKKNSLWIHLLGISFLYFPLQKIWTWFWQKNLNNIYQQNFFFSQDFFWFIVVFSFLQVIIYKLIFLHSWKKIAYKTLALNFLLWSFCALLWLNINANVLLNWSIFQLFSILLITYCGDIGGYFVGFYGKNKITPIISPKKTWEGLIGSIFFATGGGIIFYKLMVQGSFSLTFIFAKSLIIALVGFCGDIFYSKVKRVFQVKDFSSLLKGHGGIIDRFDSLIFVTIFYQLFTLVKSWKII